MVLPSSRLDTSRLIELLPQAVLPCQFAPAHTQQPEKRLMLAVLKDALDVLRHREAVRDCVPRLRAQAESWVPSDDRAWPFSFLNICQALDLDVGRLRTVVRQWKDALGRADSAVMIRNATG
jgi:hypothetical protein